MTKLWIRYYDPTLGRFTQPDPTGQDPHYTYARNNSVNFTDPTGAYSIKDAARTIGAFGGAGAGIGSLIGCVVTCPAGAAAGAAYSGVFGTSLGIGYALVEATA